MWLRPWCGVVVASGDIRNVVETIAGLPTEFAGKVESCSNDKDLGVKEYDTSELTNKGEAVFSTDGISYTMDYRITA